jgi:phosphinothricin acetyltransferase
MTSVMSVIVTRAAGAGDLAAITGIYADEVTNGTATFEIVPPDTAEMARRMENLVADGYPWFVAERAGVVLGYAYAGPYRARPAYRNTVEDSIYLARQARGLGIGGTLLRLLVDETTRRGFRQMVAVIGDTENVASLRLHRAAGFADVGTLRSVGYKHGRWLDSVLMQRTLGAGDTAAPER